MILIIGGAYNGKKEYAKEQFSLTDKDLLEGENASYEDLFTCKAMNHFHEWVKQRLLEEQDLSQLVSRLQQENPDIYIISNELGYGVVPIDAFERVYREATGRICTQLAAASAQVHRVVCKIGRLIKDA